MNAREHMIAMRALETAARAKGNGLAWLWGGEVAELLELVFGACRCGDDITRMCEACV